MCISNEHTVLEDSHGYLHALPDVCGAVIFNPDNLEIWTVIERTLSNYLECAWKVYRLQATVREGEIFNYFYSFVQCSLFHESAVLERVLFYGPDATRNGDTFYPALLETVCPYFLEPARKSDVLQTRTTSKGFLFNTFYSFWEINFRETAAAFERAFSNCLQVTSFLERYFL